MKFLIYNDHSIEMKLIESDFNELMISDDNWMAGLVAKWAI